MHQIVIFFVLLSWRRSSRTCVLITAALLSCTSETSTQSGFSIQWFFVACLLVLMDEKRTYMRFNDRSIAKFHVLLRFLCNDVTAFSDFCCCCCCCFHGREAHIHAFLCRQHSQDLCTSQILIRNSYFSDSYTKTVQNPAMIFLLFFTHSLVFIFSVFFSHFLHGFKSIKFFSRSTHLFFKSG